MRNYENHAAWMSLSPKCSTLLFWFYLVKNMLLRNICWLLSFYNIKSTIIAFKNFSQKRDTQSCIFHLLIPLKKQNDNLNKVKNKWKFVWQWQSTELKSSADQEIVWNSWSRLIKDGAMDQMNWKSILVIWSAKDNN